MQECFVQAICSNKTLFIRYEDGENEICVRLKEKKIMVIKHFLGQLKEVFIRLTIIIIILIFT